MSSAARPRRRWFQFSLKTLIVSVLVSGSVAGWLAAEFNRARQQHAAAKAVAELPHCRNSVGFESPDSAKQPPGLASRLVRWCLGDEYARNVLSVSVRAIAPTRGDTWAPVGDKELDPIRHFPELKGLWLIDTNAGNYGLSFLRGCSKLKELSILASLLDDQGMANLAGLERLEALHLLSPHVSDAGLVHLGNLRRLKTLSLSCARVRGPGLAHLKGLAELESLHLSRTQVTDAGLEHVASLAALRELDLSGTAIEGAGLARLARLPDLSTLRLDAAALFDDGLRQLRAGPSLNRLSLSGTTISDAGLDDLDRLAGLEWLSLSGTRVTDAGLAELARLPRLKYLDLSGTRVSDEGIAALNDMPSLAAVSLADTKVSASGVAALKPGGGIERGYQRIIAALDEPSDVDFFDFVETPLTDVIEYLKTEHDVEIQLDSKALNRLGVSFEVPVTQKLWGVSLPQVLDKILPPLGLTHVVRHEVLLITSDPPPPKFRIPQLAATAKLPEPIAAALQEKTEIDFVDTPLADVAEYLASKHGIPFMIDHDAFRRAGRSEEIPITRNLHGVTLRSVLELVLDHEDLTCVVEDDSLVIRPRRTASRTAGP